MWAQVAERVVNATAAAWQEELPLPPLRSICLKGQSQTEGKRQTYKPTPAMLALLPRRTFRVE